MSQEYNDQLLDACSSGKLDIVNELIEKGADVNCKNGDGRTGLMRASKRGYDKIVEKLLEKKADVAARDKNNDTALMGAAKHGYRYICELYAKKGDANPSVTAKISVMETEDAHALFGD